MRKNQSRKNDKIVKDLENCLKVKNEKMQQLERERKDLKREVKKKEITVKTAELEQLEQMERENKKLKLIIKEQNKHNEYLEETLKEWKRKTYIIMDELRRIKEKTLFDRIFYWKK